ncbi:ParB/RepB/Spo0J family partition protein [Agrobacterium vitis]|uniref:ParB/RepB/Spo0J family partition protein n=1 Tax=Allorhizobium ampelinum TaxID=3025782 RepID=UPI001F250C04|nr:ParB/RepB/Spo0J family partition protein [Allorhizobium ampelinum]MCF1450194.1 ParB/RepB/Spo0J family partition protein [Allorhizobium ampelinum]
MNTEFSATEVQMIALNKLDRDPLNVRKTYTAQGIEELAATIRADGFRLLQNIIVRKGDKKGRFFVVAGGRRLAALTLLADAGEIAKDFPVECKVREADDAAAISLTENVAREQMHPADEFDAFQAMHEAGKPIADIAARFGVSDLIVKRRLSLARVSPKLIQHYRNDEMSLAQLTAFTVTDDEARQEEVWETVKRQYHKDPSSIKGLLHQNAVKLTDPRVRLVTVEAYEAAGGDVTRDLFEDKNGYVHNIDLLNSLVMKKLEAVASDVQAEGWKWVSVHESWPSDVYHSMTRVYPNTVEAVRSDEEQAEVEQLWVEHEQLEALIEADGDDEVEQRFSEIEKRIAELTATQSVYAPEDIEKAGGFVYLDRDAEIKVERGLVRREDAKAANQTARGVSGDAVAADPCKLSAALVQELSAQKTAAIRAALAHNPDVALAAVVHSLLLSTTYQYASAHTSLDLRLTSERLENSIKNVEDIKAIQELESFAENYGHALPGSPEQLWDWCLARDQQELLNLLAFTAAQSVNAIQLPHCDRAKERGHANAMAVALKMDMHDWFEPTVENYFGRVSKSAIEKALSEAKSEDFAKGIAQMKKGEAAAYAADHIAGTGWLPDALHIANPADMTEDTDTGEDRDFQDEFQAAAE